jgi:hypothetical protein
MGCEPAMSYPQGNVDNLYWWASNEFKLKRSLDLLFSRCQITYIYSIDNIFCSYF